MPAKPYYKIASLEKGLKIIELLAVRHRLTVTEVSRALKQDRSASNRFLLTLKELGYVSVDDAGRYSLSLKLFEIGNKVGQLTEIRFMARRYMRKLAHLYRQTVYMGRFDGHDIVTIEVVFGRDYIKVDAQIGDRLPAHSLAMGKAVLGFRPPAEQQHYLATAELTPLTPHTITDRTLLQAELDRVRQLGYALSDEEWAPGVRSVAVPILDNKAYPTHAIGISGLSQRMTNDTIERMAKDLLAQSRALSLEMGATISMQSGSI